MKACSFPGMTRDEYDANIEAIKRLCLPSFRKVPGLLPNGLPDMSALLAAAALVRRSMPSIFLDDSSMYRKERPKTGARENARRRRQQAS